MADETPARSANDAANAPAIPAGAAAPTATREEPVYATGSSRRPKRKINWLIVGVVAVVLVIGGVLLWRYLSSYESTDDAQGDVHLYPVSARIYGQVIHVNVGDNQWVQAGTVLVEIDPKDYETALAQAEANLASAQATAQSLNITVPITTVNTTSQIKSSSSDIESADAGVAAAEKQVTAAHAQLEQAVANDVRAQADLQRYGLLVQKQEVSQQIYDQALATAKSSASAVAAAKANEAAAEDFVRQANGRVTDARAAAESAATGPQQVTSTRARVRAAIADVQQRQALLDQARLNLSYTKIVAPVSGEVNKSVVEGWNVQPGQQLLTVVPLDQVWVTANFKETQLRYMQVGQKAKLHVDSTGQTLNGHVDSIAGATGPLFSLLPPQNATGNYVKIVQRVPVKIVLEPGENRDLRLRPGMNVVADVLFR